MPIEYTRLCERCLAPMWEVTHYRLSCIQVSDTVVMVVVDKAGNGGYGGGAGVDSEPVVAAAAVAVVAQVPEATWEGSWGRERWGSSEVAILGNSMSENEVPDAAADVECVPAGVPVARWGGGDGGSVQEVRIDAAADPGGAGVMGSARTAGRAT